MYYVIHYTDEWHAEIGAQILIVFVGGAAFQVTPLPGREWGISIALGFVSIPWGAITRLMPNEPFERVFKKMGLLGKEEDILPSSRTDSNVWLGAANVVKDNLNYFSNVRGGRMRASSFVGKSRSARLSSEKIAV
jgi:Ca2+-transporting ATPase